MITVINANPTGNTTTEMINAASNTSAEIIAVINANPTGNTSAEIIVIINAQPTGNTTQDILDVIGAYDYWNNSVSYFHNNPMGGYCKKF